MKNKFLSILVISILTILTVNGQDNSKKMNPIGSWNFEAPYSPEGYNSGTILVGSDSTTMSFAGNENKLYGDKVKISNDSVSFSLYLEGEDIRVMLKMESDTSMSGKAVYSQGEVPITLKKAVALAK